MDQAIKDTVTPKGNLEEASSSLTYAIIGLFCLGFIFGPMAIAKGMKALNIIEKDPGYQGKGKAIAGLTIGIIETLFYGLALLIRLSRV